MSVKVFGNDFAMDIKSDFNNLMGLGKTLPEIEAYILSYMPDDWDEDSCVFWSAFALIEWEYGVLHETIKQKAIEIIRNNDDTHLFDNPKDRVRRKKVLDDLIIQLDTSNDKPRKPKNTFVFHSNWKQGDVFALFIKGHYVYFHVSEIQIFQHKIKELQEDEVFVKVFSCISEELLDLDALLKMTSVGNRYIDLNTQSFGEPVYTKWLWCHGFREKKQLDQAAKVIGNLEIEEKNGHSVWADFQYQRLEKTICKLFRIQ